MAPDKMGTCVEVVMTEKTLAYPAPSGRLASLRVRPIRALTTTAELDKYLTTTSAAKILGVSPNMVLRYVWAGRLRATRDLNDRWLIERTDVKEMAAVRARILRDRARFSAVPPRDPAPAGR
jgi:excisionase family DNA binding protein